jgi:hypothetical protein
LWAQAVKVYKLSVSAFSSLPVQAFSAPSRIGNHLGSPSMLDRIETKYGTGVGEYKPTIQPGDRTKPSALKHPLQPAIMPAHLLQQPSLIQHQLNANGIMPFSNRSASMQIGYFRTGFLRGFLALLVFFLLQLLIAFAEQDRPGHEYRAGDSDDWQTAWFFHPQQYPLGFDQADDQDDRREYHDVKTVVDHRVHEFCPVTCKLKRYTLL